MDARRTSRPAVDALRHHPVALRRPVDTVVHSDRGSQVRPHAYVHTLRGHRLRGSMSRVGACADHAAMESFSALLHKNVPNRRRRQTREQLRPAIVVRIERTYRRGAAETPSVASRPSSLRHSSRPLTRPDRPYPNQSTELWAVP
jgi:transposase InsO family protein